MPLRLSSDYSEIKIRLKFTPDRQNGRQRKNQLASANFASSSGADGDNSHGIILPLNCENLGDSQINGADLPQKVRMSAPPTGRRAGHRTGALMSASGHSRHSR